MDKRKCFPIYGPLVALCVLLGCRGAEEQLVPSTWTGVTDGNPSSMYRGFYLLCEGNMGSNKCTLDYLDLQTGFYRKNIYAEENPGVVMELGDVGNDIQIYGEKLYAVVNCSHFVEVMNKGNAHHVASVQIPNCRYVAFHGRYAYVSSYAGPILMNKNARLGYVAKIDTATLQVVDTCVVGYQPEEMAVVGNKLYVANSGGYRAPRYDRTLSVIDLKSFKEVNKIDVGINLHRVKVDRQGKIWVSSRGDYYKNHSALYVVDPVGECVVDSLNISVTDMCLDEDHLFAIASEYSYIAGKDKGASYVRVNTRDCSVETQMFISDGTEKQIKKPYGISLNPQTKEILVTDAKDFVSPGTLYCFTKDGRKKWSVQTGDIPAHFVFL